MKTINLTSRLHEHIPQDVVLTGELYPFRKSNLVVVYVRVANATSVQVTRDFMEGVLHAPSSGLDFFHSGEVLLSPSPAQGDLRAFAAFSTFVGKLKPPSHLLVLF